MFDCIIKLDCDEMKLSFSCTNSCHISVRAKIKANATVFGKSTTINSITQLERR